MSKISRIRVEKNKNYTVISNVFVKDMNLSLKAKGLMTLIMSLPDDWDFTGRGIITQVKESETAIYSAINELIEYGYCIRLKVREAGKIIGYEYTFMESPNCDFPNTVYPNTVFPNTENPYKLSKEENKIKKEVSKESETHNFAEFWEAYPNKHGKKKALEAYLVAVSKAEPNRICAAAKAYYAANKDKNNVYWMHAANWLKNECFNDYDSAPKKTTTTPNPTTKPDYSRM